MRGDDIPKPSPLSKSQGVDAPRPGAIMAAGSAWGCLYGLSEIDTHLILAAWNAIDLVRSKSGHLFRHA